MTNLVRAGGSAITSYSLEWDSGTSGSSYSVLTGDVSNNIVLTYTQQFLTAGQTYYFRYRVQNIFGFGSYSNVLQAIAAKIPDRPATPTTSNTGTSVMISWVAPYNGGSAITGYNVQILQVDGITYKENTDYCNARTDLTIIGNTYCVIPVSVLQAAPYSLL